MQEQSIKVVYQLVSTVYTCLIFYFAKLRPKCRSMSIVLDELVESKINTCITMNQPI